MSCFFSGWLLHMPRGPGPISLLETSISSCITTKFCHLHCHLAPILVTLRKSSPIPAMPFLYCDIWAKSNTSTDLCNHVREGFGSAGAQILGQSRSHSDSWQAAGQISLAVLGLLEAISSWHSQGPLHYSKPVWDNFNKCFLLKLSAVQLLTWNTWRRWERNEALEVKYLNC